MRIPLLGSLVHRQVLMEKAESRAGRILYLRVTLAPKVLDLVKPLFLMELDETLHRLRKDAERLYDERKGGPAK